MIVGITCRLYPNKRQLEGIINTVGCCRYVYNHFCGIIREKLTKHEKFSYNDFSKELTELKKTSDHQWLNEVSHTALQQELRHLSNAVSRLFKKCGRYPRFHNRYGVQTFTITNPKIKGNSVNIPNIGYVRVNGLKRQLKHYTPGTLSSATIKLSPDGYCEISFKLRDVEPTNWIAESSEIVGIDIGEDDNAVLSDGTKYRVSERITKLYSKMEYYQGRKDCCVKHSKNWYRWYNKQVRTSRKLLHIRSGFYKNAVYDIVSHFGVLCVEDLNVQDMIRDTDEYKNQPHTNHNRNALRAAMSTFRNFLVYLANKYSRKLIIADKYFASTQICNNCGYKNESLKDTSIKEYDCPQCHTHNDRDINAAKNLRGWGVSHLYDDCTS